MGEQLFPLRGVMGPYPNQAVLIVVRTRYVVN